MKKTGLKIHGKNWVVAGFLNHQQYLREPQRSHGAYPRPPQPPKLKELRTINCWFWVWGMFQGYVGKFLDSRNLLFQISLGLGISFCVGETQSRFGPLNWGPGEVEKLTKKYSFLKMEPAGLGDVYHIEIHKKYMYICVCNFQ